MSGGAPRASEEALIARYFAPLAGEGADGLRDDAARLTPSPGHDLVLTADAVVAGVHYFPDDPPDSIAAKALGVNLSDLAAKGAAPRGFLLTLALAPDWSEDWLAAFARGLGESAERHGCPLLGGDTVKAGGATLIGVTALGEVPAGTMVRRTTASAGDRVCVSGTIGDAALGLRLRRDPAFAGSLDDDARGALADRYLRPRPRLALAPVLRRFASAAMDVSDGLAGDLAKMLKGTGLTATVEAAAVPLSPAAGRAVADRPDLHDLALTGGDDYEILCTVAPERLDAFREAAAAAGVPVRAIGTVAAGEGAPVFLGTDGRPRAFASAAFSHF
ncbi:thiamine-phosphate kinase [Methylobacterium dankookense]|uniref:Thiamine-monophosphate kinase n=1 Tax=Methylobacterium dankookense TaxID=560405 RepID=A0A564FS09_9HYPH|nr:thiamine-phosphate kinase [Methylobacterium dankookense]GJD57818.1 Thiamine-monophosphate kinase [Methylobacterium dankookense]VUF10514.1 Thiamine-monophosphate kinase [Methylobacterium dankookense]